MGRRDVAVWPFDAYQALLQLTSRNQMEFQFIEGRRREEEISRFFDFFR